MEADPEMEPASAALAGRGGAADPAACLFESLAKRDYEGLLDLYATNARNAVVSYLAMRSRRAQQRGRRSGSGALDAGLRSMFERSVLLFRFRFAHPTRPTFCSDCGTRAQRKSSMNSFARVTILVLTRSIVTGRGGIPRPRWREAKIRLRTTTCCGN